MDRSILSWLLLLVAVSACWSLPSSRDDDEEFREFLQAMQKKQNPYYDRSGDLGMLHGYGPYGDEFEARHYGNGLYNQQEEDNEVEVPEDDEEDDDWLFTGQYEAVDDWPASDVTGMGEVAGVATDAQGHPVLFHRADREWQQDTFYQNHTLRNRAVGPISADTILRLNKTDGSIIHSFGSGMFYMPHGLTVDNEGNYWVTDVALHQVFKLRPDSTEPELVLGEAFVPAADEQDQTRFCQPTDVAIMPNGDILVADGYCNRRIVRFNSKGEYVNQILDEQLWVPHGLALADDLDLLCVADRENLRVACYKAGLDDSEFGDWDRDYSQYQNIYTEYVGRPFGIEYSKQHGVMYVVTGATGDMMPQGFTIYVREDGKREDGVIARWSPNENGFDGPHDVTVAPDDEAIYVGEIEPNLIWKFMQPE